MTAPLVTDCGSVKIGKVDHPELGTFYIYYDAVRKMYGLSRVIHPIKCEWPTLALAFKDKEL